MGVFSTTSFFCISGFFLEPTYYAKILNYSQCITIRITISPLNPMLEKRTKLFVFMLEKRTKSANFALEKRTKYD